MEKTYSKTQTVRYDMSEELPNMITVEDMDNMTSAFLASAIQAGAIEATFMRALDTGVVGRTVKMKFVNGDLRVDIHTTVSAQNTPISTIVEVVAELSQMQKMTEIFIDIVFAVGRRFQ